MLSGVVTHDCIVLVRPAGGLCTTRSGTKLPASLVIKEICSAKALRLVVVPVKSKEQRQAQYP